MSDDDREPDEAPDAYPVTEPAEPAFSGDYPEPGPALGDHDPDEPELPL